MQICHQLLDCAAHATESVRAEKNITPLNKEINKFNLCSAMCIYSRFSKFANFKQFHWIHQITTHGFARRSINKFKSYTFAFVSTNLIAFFDNSYRTTECRLCILIFMDFITVCISVVYRIVRIAFHVEPSGNR